MAKKTLPRGSLTNTMPTAAIQIGDGHVVHNCGDCEVEVPMGSRTIVPRFYVILRFLRLLVFRLRFPLAFSGGWWCCFCRFAFFITFCITLWCARPCGLFLEDKQCRHGIRVNGLCNFFARRHILSPVKTVRSNLHCKNTLQQNPVGRVTRWMLLTPLGQWKFGCSAPRDPAGRPPAHEGVIYAIYHESWICIRNCKRSLANRGYFWLWSGWIS